MKVGIIGYARSGKTTIVNALTGGHAAVGAFGSRDANVAVIKVPDDRVERLAEIYKPRKIVHAEIEFVDIAPNEAGGEQKALDNNALTLLKNVDALVHVVRAFENETVVHPRGSVDSTRDCRNLEEELQLSDLIIIERKIERLAKEGRHDKEYDLLQRCAKHIESGDSLRALDLSPQELKALQGYTFLSIKPLMLVGNYDESRIGQDDPAGLRAYAAHNGFTLVEFCGAIEMEISELPEAERQAFRDDLGLGEESRTRFIHAAYDMLGLISFLTTGEPEVHAWTIHKGTKALDAAGVIHSDIQRGFIRAETVAYADLMACDGSMHKAKEHGKVRLEGKDYIVQDGDVILFRFNV
ncbi:MAG TPA: redox-regulated ATPase YchF [Candidatus Hydrogenedentes bacterium]|nr:redox-regulated ATPase YchF [Candidatus Hydrogenedentota bacterium]